MNRLESVSLVASCANSEDPFKLLEHEVSKLTSNGVGGQLLSCGIIPERFSHDSSEEKLWAKYCDILLNRSFNILGIESEVIRVRGDSADIRGVTEEYSIVGDAKAFRLSRTAKNQKDFKVTALNDWRRNDTYACLVGPLYQYPNRSSQIYEQAEEHNVTLLSYVHVRFLLDHAANEKLERIWNVARSLSPQKDARRYWEAVDDEIVAITATSYDELRSYKQMEINEIHAVGLQEISYWESVKKGHHELSREDAIRRLIRAEKIDQKIEVIRKSMDRVSRALNG